MKLTVILLLAFCLQVSARGYGQAVTINARDADLVEVFKTIRQQTGYFFVYDLQMMHEAKKVNLDVRDASLDKVLELCFRDQPLTYTLVDKTVIVRARPKPVEAAPPANIPPGDIHGQVLDESGQPLSGATIAIKGSKKGTNTDAKGQFTLNAAAGDVLVVSFVGYEPREMTVTTAFVGSDRLLAIRLAPSQDPLDGVQVTAYGTTTKRLNAGDITTITAKDIQKNPVNNVMEAIQGKVPGLFIQQVTGQPGGAFNLRLRESANFSSDAPQPLIVVDGVTYPGGTLPLLNNTLFGTTNFLQGGSGLNYLNPNDIESINVLKDADATALYGSSGAYGVVIITTKKAKPGPATLSANVYTGLSVLGQEPKLMNTAQYLTIRREALKNDGLTATSNDKDVNGTWPETRYNDYRKDLLGDYAQTTNANFSYGGGTPYTSYLISGSLRKNGNIQRHKGSSGDGSLRFSLDTRTADDKLNFEVSGTYLSSKSTMVPMDFSSDVVFAAPNGPPIFLPDGSVNWETGSNDLADDINRTYENVTNNLLASANLAYKPIKQLTFRTVLSYNNISGKELVGYPTTTMPPGRINASQQTHSLFHHYEVRTITMSPYLEFKTKLGSKGDLDITTGGKIDNKLDYWDEIDGTGFPSDALLSDPASGASVTSSYNLTPYRYLGFHGSVKFVWDRKYIVSLNGRRDGSTKFGSGKKFGNFGSVALGWIFSEEKWVRDRLPFISFGKLRASTGVVGGDAINDFAYLSKYSVVSGNYENATGLAPDNLANPRLNWEKNKDSEIGLELGFFHDRIYAEADFYRNIASNQLINNSLSTVTGFGSYPLNSNAVIRTSGWEMTLNTTNIRSRDFTWTTRFNISIPRSKLLKLPTNIKLNPKYILDKPVTGILLYKYKGVNPETGNYSFTNAQGVTDDYYYGLSDADKTEFLDLAPKYYGGLQNSFSYKQWTLDFSITFTKRVGKNFLGQTGYVLGYIGVNGGTFWLNRWQNKGDITDVPKVSTQIFSNYLRQSLFQGSTGAYSDASYARLQNLSIRYRFDDELLRRIHLKSLSVYLQGQNLLTVSHYGGLDPENLNAGVIPPMRVFTAGINISL